MTIFCSRVAEPTAFRHSHCNFVFSVWWSWLYIFPFKFSFWSHVLLEKRVLLLTRFSLFGIAQKNTHWFVNCKRKVRMSTAVLQARSSQYSSSHWWFFTFKRTSSYFLFCVKHNAIWKQENISAVFVMCNKAKATAPKINKGKKCWTFSVVMIDLSPLSFFVD